MHFYSTQPIVAWGRGEVFNRVLVGRPERKRPLGRPRRRWEDNIEMNLREIGIDGANWIWLAQDRVQWGDFVNTVMNLHNSVGIATRLRAG
jgi:hypothetical protein